MDACLRCQSESSKKDVQTKDVQACVVGELCSLKYLESMDLRFNLFQLLVWGECNHSFHHVRSLPFILLAYFIYKSRFFYVKPFTITKRWCWLESVVCHYGNYSFNMLFESILHHFKFLMNLLDFFWNIFSNAQIWILNSDYLLLRVKQNNRCPLCQSEWSIQRLSS